jgi:hypothetical protein
VIAGLPLWLILLVPAVVSLCYYLSTRTHFMLQRLLWSSHGAVLLLAFAYAVAVSPWSINGNWAVFIWPYWVLLIIFVLSAVYSLISFKGHHAIHLLQLLQVPSALMIWFTGTMTITHDWI